MLFNDKALQVQIHELNIELSALKGVLRTLNKEIEELKKQACPCKKVKCDKVCPCDKPKRGRGRPRKTDK